MVDLDTRRGKVVSASIVGGPAFAICPYIANLAIDFAFELDDAQIMMKENTCHLVLKDSEVPASQDYRALDRSLQC